MPRLNARPQIESYPLTRQGATLGKSTFPSIGYKWRQQNAGWGFHKSLTEPQGPPGPHGECTRTACPVRKSGGRGPMQLSIWERVIFRVSPPPIVATYNSEGHNSGSCRPRPRHATENAHRHGMVEKKRKFERGNNLQPGRYLLETSAGKTTRRTEVMNSIGKKTHGECPRGCGGSTHVPPWTCLFGRDYLTCRLPLSSESPPSIWPVIGSVRTAKRPVRGKVS